jgi:hypothetical protein
MSELIRRTFRVTFNIELSMSAIDEQVIAAAKQSMRLVGDDTYLDAFIRRNQALLQALLAHPAALSAFLVHRAAEAVEHIQPDDDSLQTIQNTLDDTTLVEHLKDALSADDYAFLKEACEDDVLYDNTSFFEEAISIRQSNFTIQPLAETRNPTNGN